MNASELKKHVEQARHDSYFFKKETMKFFGDTMRNYGVRKAVIDTYGDKNVPVWELYRKHPVKNGLDKSAYFRQETFEQIFKIHD